LKSIIITNKIKTKIMENSYAEPMVKKETEFNHLTNLLRERVMYNNELSSKILEKVNTIAGREMGHCDGSEMAKKIGRNGVVGELLDKTDDLGDTNEILREVLNVLEDLV
jgi:hypothetical protein